jgi:hypothetical protein
LLIVLQTKGAAAATYVAAYITTTGVFFAYSSHVVVVCQ